MRTFETTLPGVVVFGPRRLSDSRGFFVETFQTDRYASWGAPDRVVIGAPRPRKIGWQ